MPFTKTVPVPCPEDMQRVHPVARKPLLPALPVDHFYHLVMKEKKWTSLSGDNCRIRYAESEKTGGVEKPEARPFEADIRSHHESLWRQRLVIRHTETEQPIAVWIKMVQPGRNSKDWKLYTFTPNVAGQKASEKRQYDGRALYELARVTSKGYFSDIKFMTFVDGTVYRFEPVGGFLDGIQYRVACNDIPLAHITQTNLAVIKGQQWDIKIAPGVDPLIITSFVAVWDVVNEGK